MITWGFFYGIITEINNTWSGPGRMTGCTKIMTAQGTDGNIVNFLINPTTYFVNHEMMVVGDTVIGYYDLNAPVPLIYPPQLQAIVVAKLVPEYNVKVDYFDEHLISRDGFLRLIIGPDTQIILENNQPYTCNPANNDLIVLYGPTTRSIPARTTPYKIIVICPKHS